VKYKETARGDIDDLYQLLAYCSATGLARGLLVYATAAHPTTHEVVRNGPQLRVDTIDIMQPHEVLMARCREVAEQIAVLTKEAST
jgi:5-methylcytosine-specific restriction enzyme subunit McrC